MRYFLAAMFAATIAMAPLSAEAALVNCGTRANPSPCTICHLVQGGVSLMNWGLTIMSAIGIVVIVAMAIMYIVSAGDEGMMQTAKGGIKAALIGFAVMLSAWLIVHTTLRIFGANSLTGYQQGSNIFSFTCNTASSAGSAQAAPQQNTGPIVNSAPVNSDSRSAYVADAPVDGPIVVPEGSFLASVTISGNGTVLPGYRSVVSGQTTQFTIVPEGTATITSVTGCGGTLSGTTYVTGPVTGACSITATFAGGSPVAPVEEETTTVAIGTGGGSKKDVVTPAPAGWTVYDHYDRFYSSGLTIIPRAGADSDVPALSETAGLAFRFVVPTDMGQFRSGVRVSNVAGGPNRIVISRSPGSKVPVDGQDGTKSVNGDSKNDSCIGAPTIRYVVDGVYYAGYTSAYGMNSLLLESTCFLSPGTYYLNAYSTAPAGQASGFQLVRQAMIQ